MATVDIANTIPVKCDVENINARPKLIWQVARMKVGDRIRELRRSRKGLTQVKLAAEIGWERGTLAGIETGASLPGREMIQALASYFGVSVDYLLGQDEADGATTPLDERERQVVELFRRSPGTAQESVIGLLKITAGAA